MYRTVSAETSARPGSWGIHSSARFMYNGKHKSSSIFWVGTACELVSNRCSTCTSSEYRQMEQLGFTECGSARRSKYLRVFCAEQCLCQAWPIGPYDIATGCGRHSGKLRATLKRPITSTDEAWRYCTPRVMGTEFSAPY